MAEMPVEPRLAKCLLASLSDAYRNTDASGSSSSAMEKSQGCTEEMLSIAAMCSVDYPFISLKSRASDERKQQRLGASCTFLFLLLSYYVSHEKTNISLHCLPHLLSHSFILFLSFNMMFIPPSLHYFFTLLEAMSTFAHPDGDHMTLLNVFRGFSSILPHDVYSPLPGSRGQGSSGHLHSNKQARSWCDENFLSLKVGATQ